ncbi:MAG: MATE family efflux transporter [Clostridia bacterium]
MVKSSKYEIDMCTGPLMPKMIKFAIPLMLANTLQLLYNAADVIVVGNFAGTQSLSAVGSTGTMINLVICLFSGMSVGTSVVMSQNYGSKNYEGMQKTVHTSIMLAIIGGVLMGAIGYILTPTLLELMNSPEDVIGKATTYMRIYFLGMPFNMVYMFGSAILRAVGDTKRPLYFLSIAGLFNVGLNLIFVIVFHMDVAGVAIATITAQAISMVFVVRCLIKSEGPLNFNYKKLKIHNVEFVQILKIGLPAGVQGAMFSVSNVIIQSTINTFGSVVMAACAASSSIEGFIFTSMNAISQANVNFASQNLGAKKYKRMRRCLWTCLGLVVIVLACISGIIFLFSEQLVSLYNSDPEVIAIGVYKLKFMAVSYLVCAFMDVTVSHLRGIGKSLIPMITSIVGVCGLRIFWIYVIFPINPVIESVYWSYPISWFITAATLLIGCAIVSRKFPKEDLQ